MKCEIEMVVFDERPKQDTIWAMTAHPDGKIYVALCGELEGGLSVHIARYDPETRRVEYLLDVARALGEDPDNGHATHSKLHHSMIPGDDDLLYCATHCSGAPAGDDTWRPWQGWDDPVKSFTGFHIFTFNVRTGEVNDLGQPFPNEGCRTLSLDTRRRKLYGITYPRDHLFVFYLDERRCVDLGRIGEFNPMCVFFAEGADAVYTTDDDGFILRIDGDTNEIERLDARLPFTSWRGGFHNVIYDVVASPDGRSVYGCNWGFERKLFRFDFAQESVCDLGPAFGTDPEHWCEGELPFHVGGMVFGADGMLYYAVHAWWEDQPQMWLVRMNVHTHEREALGPVRSGDFLCRYVGRASRDRFGNLYFATCVTRPLRIFILRPEIPFTAGDVATTQGSPSYIRRWG